MSEAAVRPASRITGTGRSVPPGILTNADLERMVETSDEWITTRTGIKERHIVEPGTPASELASEAALQALERAGRTAGEVDYIIVGTVTGDSKFPASANFVQARIGADRATTYDVSAACSGFLFALDQADLYIRAGKAKVVLAIGVEILSSITNYEDRGTCILFGDGAGAAVLEPAAGDGRGVLSTYTGTNGRLSHLLHMPGGGAAIPGKDREAAATDFTIHMAGNEVFKYAVKTMGDAAVTALKRAGLSSADLDMLVPHQANIRIIDATAKRLKLDPEKVYTNVDRYGNTSAASIPIALDEALELGAVKEGDLVLMVAFGGGFTWASSAVRL